jgi:hypothetical protein
MLQMEALFVLDLGCLLKDLPLVVATPFEVIDDPVTSVASFPIYRTHLEHEP